MKDDMILNKEHLNDIKTSGKVPVPEEFIFSLPEKVLQFGTGVLLRGLPGYFIDKANKAGMFNGRVAVVKSTARGGTDDFEKQDGLYTLGIRGVKDGQKIEENIVCSAISRVINAQTSWGEVLLMARSKDLEIIISNTTEAGIQLSSDDITALPPVSFPGKLLAVLYERYKSFNGAADRGLVILPTELISNNGTVLKEIVFALAHQNQLEEQFLLWLDQSNTFSNTLVDRIVPGKPDDSILSELEQQLGYHDELLIIAEAYRLWAIEGDEKLKDVLSFEKADDGVVIASDISKFKELKLRLLNGSHTLTCGLAVLAGFDSVDEAMTDPQFSGFISDLLHEDLSRAIPYPVPHEEALLFAANVLDRFRNPYIKHHWMSISVNYTLKFKMRVVPLLLRYYENFKRVPEHIALGFAGYLLFMRSEQSGQDFLGVAKGKSYKVEEEHAAYFSKIWAAYDTAGQVILETLSNTQLWDADLSALPGFPDAVKDHLQNIERFGALESIKRINSKKTHNEAK